MSQWSLYKALQDSGVVIEDEAIAACETMLLTMNLLDEDTTDSDQQVILTLRTQLQLSNRVFRETLAHLKNDEANNPLSEAPPYLSCAYRLYLLHIYADMDTNKRVFDYFPDDEAYKVWVRRQVTVICLGIAFASLDASEDILSITTKVVDVYKRLGSPLDENNPDVLTEIDRLVFSVVPQDEQLMYGYPLNTILYTKLISSIYDDEGAPLYNAQEILSTLRVTRDALFISPVLDSICQAHVLKVYQSTYEVNLLKNAVEKLHLTHTLTPTERTHLQLLSDELVELVKGYRVQFASNPDHIGAVLALLEAAETVLRPEGSATAIKTMINRALCDGVMSHIDRVVGGKKTLDIEGALAILPTIIDELKGDLEYFTPHMTITVGIGHGYSQYVKDSILPLLKEINPDTLAVLLHIRTLSELIAIIGPVIDMNLIAPEMLMEWDAGLRSTHEALVKRMIQTDPFDQGIMSDEHNHTCSAVDLFAMLSGWMSALKGICEAIWGARASEVEDSWHWWFSLSSVLCEAIRVYKNTVSSIMIPRSKLVPSYVSLWRAPRSGSSARFGRSRNADSEMQIPTDLADNRSVCLRINSLLFVRDELSEISHTIAQRSGDFGGRIEALIKDVQEEVGCTLDVMMAFLAMKLVYVDLRDPLLRDLWCPKPPDCRLIEVLHHFDKIINPIVGSRGDLCTSQSDKVVALIMVEMIGALEYVIVTAHERKLYGNHVFIMEDDIVALEDFFVGIDDQGIEQGLDRGDVSGCLRRLRTILTHMDLDSDSLKKMYRSVPDPTSDGLACVQPVDKAVVYCLLRQRDDKVAKAFTK